MMTSVFGVLVFFMEMLAVAVVVAAVELFLVVVAVMVKVLSCCL